MKSKKENKSVKKDKEVLRDSPEESLNKLIEVSKLKTEAYKKILKSLNTNKNK